MLSFTAKHHKHTTIAQILTNLNYFIINSNNKSNYKYNITLELINYRTLNLLDFRIKMNDKYKTT